VHLIGCAGSGMRALAEFGADEGWRLTGSDAVRASRSVEGLARVGLAIRSPHAATNLPDSLDAVVFSPAVPESNVERAAAAARNAPQHSYPQVLGELSRRFPTIGIAGTHGKSTTTALIAAILSAAGRDRAVVCGAELLGRGRHGWAGHGDWTVMEACEYRRHFLELSPRIGVVLGIEPDHFDCFPSLEDAVDAYARFMDCVEADGSLIVNADCLEVRRAVAKARPRRLETMSATPRFADWWIDNVEQVGRTLRLRVLHRGDEDCRIETLILGRHHAMNVLAAVVACRTAGILAEDVESGLSAFSGLHRRLERLPDWNGIMRYDDYAHHPTAVRAVLAALRGAHPEARIVCAFQPHQLSRTEVLHAEFAAALSLADFVAVLPVYAARESAAGDLVEASRRLAEAIGGTARGLFSPSLDQLRDTLQTAGRPGDLLVTLGAGDIDRLHHALL
jgi:UDP-N-acetylmuramate--alanine ligase